MQIHSDCDIDIDETVNGLLWAKTIGAEIKDNFANAVFEIVVSHGRGGTDEWMFWHKESGLKILWNQKTFQNPRANMGITPVEFLNILRDCANSLHPDYVYRVHRWWKKKVRKRNER